MKNIINKLFKENNFIQHEDNVFNFEDQDSFITSEYTEPELINFFECDKTKNILANYKARTQEFPNYKKNSSLLIYLKVTNISDTQSRLKNTVFNIEEDEYYFRKFILFYTDEMIERINLNRNVLEQLKEIVDKGDIDKLQENSFHDLSYFFALQLFIKLPWLSFNVERTTFELLDGPLKRKLEASKLIHFDKLFDDINENSLDALIEKNSIDDVKQGDFDDLLKLLGEQV